MDPRAIHRNIELKARVAHLSEAHRQAGALATERLGVELQVDTYFACRAGRLKIREREGRAAVLIAYARADEAAPRPSDYLLTTVAEPAQLKAALAASLGVVVTVRKRREVFRYHNVRIHVDQVAELGSFLEFEAVLDDEADEAVSRARLERLTEAFGLRPSDLIPGSYADMAGDADHADA